MRYPVAFAALLAPLLTLAVPAAAQDLTRAHPPEDLRDEAQRQRGRIAAFDDAGPRLNAVIAAKAPRVLAYEVAEALAKPLGGRTVLIKDNIETREWPTTAGSLALAGNATGRDAPLIARLRDAGGVVMGKTNLSEWANIRSSRSTSGWSAVGGQTGNPHGAGRNPCGSSSGSAAAVAAGMAWAAIGTETDGSITCPASATGIVGFKPTVGLVSRTHVIPISSSQDTPGPMARTVADVAMLLGAIAGSDPADPATTEADARKRDFASGVADASLAGVRIGVLRRQVGGAPGVGTLFDLALADLRRAGAELVEVDYRPDPAMGSDELAVLLFELREELTRYLQASPAPLPVRSLGEVIAFNQANAVPEMRWFGQELFLAAAEANDGAAYRQARARSLRLAGSEGIDRLLSRHRVQFLVAPTAGPAWLTDLVNGDHYEGGIGAGSLAAIAGYPHLTVPMGSVEGLPVGLSLIGARWSDAAVLTAGAAYEAARTAALPEPVLTGPAEATASAL